MQVVITHVTRMQPGYVCVAGQRVGDDASIRPVLPGTRIPRSLTSPEGGPFWVGHRVDLGPTTPCGKAPEVEDHSFVAANARVVAQESPTALWQLLGRCARARFGDIFGSALEPAGATAALPEGRGDASLGVLRPQSRPTLDLFGTSVKLRVRDAAWDLNVRVTDVRLYHKDGTLRHDAYNALAGKLRAEPCLLTVGVGRPWKRDGDDAPRHWLQVNGIHFPSGPDWS